MKFPYVKVKTRTAEGEAYEVLLPLIPVGVRYQDKTLRYVALLDSGAEMSMFHGQLAQALGIDLTRGTRRTFYGVGHGQTVGSIHSVDLEVGGLWVACPVAFCPELARPDPTQPGRIQGLSYGILGQVGLFDRFRVVFDRRVQQIELIPKPV